MLTIQDCTANQIRNIRSDDCMVVQDIQNYGSDPRDCVDFINDTLTHGRILLNGSRFERAYRFEHAGKTHLLFDFHDAEVDMFTAALWCLCTKKAGVMWIRDYVMTVLDSPEMEPKGMEFGGM